MFLKTKLAIRQRCSKSRNYLLRKHKGTDAATIVRGIAALGVLLIHYQGIGIRTLFAEGTLPFKLSNYLIDLGALGPIAFFIASGFSLTASLQVNPVNIKSFLIKRYFRLCPLFVIVYMLFSIYNFSRSTTLDLDLIRSWFFKFTFLDLFFPKEFNKSILDITWSIPVEFWFSLFSPLIFYHYKKNTILLKISLIIAGFLPTLFFLNYTLSTYNPHNPYFYSAFFIIGNVSFYIKKIFTKVGIFNKHRHYKIFLLVIYLLMLVEMFRGIYFVVFSTTTYLIFWELKEKSVIQFLSNTFIIIGNICYSIYLLHIPVLVLCLRFFEEHKYIYIQATLTTVLISIITYLYIELPFIRLAQKLTIIK